MLSISVIVIAAVFVIGYKFNFQLNPYIQIAIAIAILCVEFFTLAILGVNPVIVFNIFLLSTLVVTIFVGISFIRYYQRLSKMQDDKINGGKK
jgi:hypothetical protein